MWPSGHDNNREKNTLINDIKYWSVDTCRFKPAPTGLTGPSPSAVEDELLPPFLVLALFSK